MATPTTLLLQGDALLRPLPDIEAQTVHLWQEGRDGKRPPSTVQAADDHGVPLRGLQVLGHEARYERAQPQFIMPRIAPATRPAVDELGLVPMLGGAA